MSGREVKPVCPTSVYVHHELLNLRRAMGQGDTNPHIVLRDLLGRVYAEGWHDGFVATLSDRPLPDEPTS